MKDSEIVKAKELIKKLGEAYDNYYDSSKGIPYNIDTTLLHSAICFKNLLNELNRLQAQNDKLYETIDYRADKITELEDKLKTAKAENERLKYANQTNISSIATLHEELKTAKAEAYKEFAEKAKEFMHNKFKALDEYEFEYITESDIDNLIKEIIGE